MKDPDFYFKNNVILFGKVADVIEKRDDYVSFKLETKEIWPDGSTLIEAHEVRYYNTNTKAQLDADGILGRLVEVSGRIRSKNVHSNAYTPFIHCHKLTVT